MRFSVVTILPELVEPALTAGVVGRAREAGTITVTTTNPRDFTHDRHRSVDDTPYGGGPGMVMRPAPMIAAIAAAAGAVGAAGASHPEAGPPAHRILLSPGGKPLTQARVRELATLPHLVLVCGRYEGIDERVIETAIDEQISIGDYVLSGGELGALVIIDAVARFVPGVLGDASSADDESFSEGLLEYPQYTRPPELDGNAIPPVLVSGNHAAIEAWRRLQSMTRTAQRRPDLWARHQLTDAERKLLVKNRTPPLHARTHLALVHHPIVDRTGKVITSALTNFDIHDLARSSMTYGLANYHIITPVTSQRDKATYIANLWMEDAAAAARAGSTADGRDPKMSEALADSRAQALQLVRTADSIETVIGELTDRYGIAPLVVATSARPGAFPAAERRTPAELVSEASFMTAPVLVLLGTGWGLAEELIPSVSRVLAPIEGPSPWNHLSVRSAAAVVLDRLFGRPT